MPESSPILKEVALSKHILSKKASFFFFFLLLLLLFIFLKGKSRVLLKMPLLIWFLVYHLIAHANSRTKSSIVLISVSTNPVGPVSRTLFPSLQNRSSCDRVPLVVSPWYNRNGWLGVKHQVTCVPLVTGTEILAPSLPDFLESRIPPLSLHKQLGVETV